MIKLVLGQNQSMSGQAAKVERLSHNMVNELGTIHSQKSQCHKDCCTPSVGTLSVKIPGLSDEAVMSLRSSKNESQKVPPSEAKCYCKPSTSAGQSGGDENGSA